ncbi:HTH-type transcriptional repressor RspR [Fusobacterium sp. DD29]|uniref:GntR family transcriptional regulator n=1 Tax=unclassified Fusobacterium TaxID=2648384 RepID=UPI001B8AFB65|nr:MULTISPECIES: GntR family transcriptional regulator [unclassified Fusobacterium]MBR8748615.1 HTH-type transcriptional repressor RspR [Fusobacterium sp. DD29]MBR8760921.1 HTH-type transcriptional repressor RspR [Fusobacterium sp. DD25]MBR8766933.1 HTH-type transcriptional repressor RspR [Fusobacterium sp. DD43]MBR8770895.1 HTH-type transcriptional repressor RspR [Fusobacterium sp. DD40]MBR8775170.1 HTH-type transcriptional repressor RspR [Fusobacterium sp. DD17]
MELIKINRQFGENTKHYIYRILKMNIMTLTIKPGTIISEADICSALSVSRTPIREAIVRLSEELLMNVYPQKGSFVSLIDLNIVEEAYFMRKILEKEILRLAIDNFSEAGIKELEKNLKFQNIISQVEEDHSELFFLDNEFHRLIYKEVGKEKVWNSIQSLSTHYDRVRFLDAVEKTNLIPTLEQHKEILEIIKNKEKDKVDSIVDCHLSNFKNKMDYLLEKYPSYFA